MNTEAENIALKGLNEKYSKSNFTLERATGGIINDVYFYDIDGKKEVIKVLDLDNLYSEVFFLTQAEKVGANVPHVYTLGVGTKDKGYFIMNFIQGDVDFRADIDKFLNGLVENIQKIQQVKLEGFGRYSGEGLDRPRFAFATWHSWLDMEIQRLIDFFEARHKTTVLDALQLVQKSYPSLIPDTHSSVLTHGDIGIRNTFFDGKTTYIFDPRINRAMPPLWDIAHFDYSYFNDPETSHIGGKFKQLYFSGNITAQQDAELTFYRALIVFSQYKDRLDGVAEKPTFLPKVERNIQAIQGLLKNAKN